MVSAASWVVEKLPIAVVLRPPSWVAVMAPACVVLKARTSVGGQRADLRRGQHTRPGWWSASETCVVVRLPIEVVFRPRDLRGGQLGRAPTASMLASVSPLSCVVFRACVCAVVKAGRSAWSRSCSAAVVVRPPSWAVVSAPACVVLKACTSVVLSEPICVVVSAPTWVVVSVETCVVVRLVTDVGAQAGDLLGRELV